MIDKFFTVYVIVGVLVWFTLAVILKRWSDWPEPDAVSLFVGFTWPASLIMGIIYLIYWLVSTSTAFIAGLGKKD